MTVELAWELLSARHPEWDPESVVRVLSERRRYVQASWPAGDRGAVRAARDLVAPALNRWDAHVSCDDVALCVSELVTNAVVHPRALSSAVGVTVGIRHFPARAVVVEVGDADPVVPADAPGHGVDDEGLALRGRGLMIVRTLADFFWWAAPVGGGKVACARFDYRSEATS